MAFHDMVKKLELQDMVQRYGFPGYASENWNFNMVQKNGFPE